MPTLPTTLPTTPLLSAAFVVPSTLRVLVKIDTPAAEKLVRVADLARTVRAIWRPYAEIVFVDVSNRNGDGHDDSHDDEVQLVISDRPGSAVSGGSALGWITFVAPGRPGNVVTVSVATARTLMTHDSWMGRRFDQLPLTLSQQLVTRAISWSVAHEIGHYLLRTSAHGTAGLMKAQLSAADVMQNDREWVKLGPREVEALQRRRAHSALLADTAPSPARSE